MKLFGYCEYDNGLTRSKQDKMRRSYLFFSNESLLFNEWSNSVGISGFSIEIHGWSDRQRCLILNVLNIILKIRFRVPLIKISFGKYS